MFDIWFMFDNHRFAKIETFDRDEIIDLFDQDGCGSLFVRDQGAEMSGLARHGRQLEHRSRYGLPRKEIEQWADAVLAELSFRKTMCA